MSDTARNNDVHNEGWGHESLPYPQGPAFIHSRDDLCVGCGICEMACAMFHFQQIHRELSRIRIVKYLTPLSKAVQSVCVQCETKERECEKACPVTPAAISYDETTQHMTVATDRCIGFNCGKCRDACPAQIPRFHPPIYKYPLVCDLCEKDGKRQPRCVDACPTNALEFLGARDRRYLVSTAHLWRIHPNKKAEFIAKRLHPLTKDIVGYW